MFSYNSKKQLNISQGGASGAVYPLGLRIVKR